MVYNFMNQQDIQNPFIIAHIIAQGKVQGVGYRKFAKASADTLGIVGSTENLASGEVEIYAMCKREEGGEEIMLDFVNALWSGPARGEVQNLIINHIDIEAWEAQEKTILDFLGCDNASDLTQTISNAKSSKNAKPNGFRARLQDFVILK
ncbi:acylphosphatase [Helicobacter sp. T3_23-1059]